MTKRINKERLEEIFEGSMQDPNIHVSPIAEKTFSVKTRFRNAETVAFNQARKFAKRIGSKIIHYINWSGANPDFMNGDDEAKPHEYELTAVFY